MPELPDVEGFRRELARHGRGHIIQQVVVADSGVLRNAGRAQLQHALEGRSFADPDRHGKWLLAHTDGPTLLIHFGMTGNLRWFEDSRERHRHDRVVLVLDRGELRYRDMRKLRGLWLAHSPGHMCEIMGHQGPDALVVPPSEFHGLLTRRRRTLKPALMDQRLIAGLGNLLSDEMLWQARIHPKRLTIDLSESELSTLHRMMRKVLRESLPEGCVPGKPRWLTGHRDMDRVCPRCHTPLRHQPIGGRTTYWCSKCQPAPG
jgi:formamidopyrimidine-DNA glycosylase